MGNIPLCVPKRGGPVVFTEGYHAGSRHLPMKPYHPYQSSLEDLLSPSINPQNSDDNTNVYTNESKRQSILVGEDTAIIGLELEQDSVRLTNTASILYTIIVTVASYNLTPNNIVI